jgi:hypothetical protein
MLKSGKWRLFLAGVLCGVMFTIGTASIWWRSHAARSVKDDAFFDNCLIKQNGNTVYCDALMWALARDRAASKKEAAELLAVGVSEREVVNGSGTRGLATHMWPMLWESPCGTFRP